MIAKSSSSLLSLLIAEDEALAKEELYGEMIVEYREMAEATDNQILRSEYAEEIAKYASLRDDAINEVLSTRDMIRNYLLGRK